MFVHHDAHGDVKRRRLDSNDLGIAPVLGLTSSCDSLQVEPAKFRPVLEGQQRAHDRDEMNTCPPWPGHLVPRDRTAQAGRWRSAGVLGEESPNHPVGCRDVSRLLPALDEFRTGHRLGQALRHRTGVVLVVALQDEQRPVEAG